MSKITIAPVTCPKCQHGWNQAIHSSVNVTLDPALKERVLIGDLFRMQCPSCGTITALQYDCLYHDMNKGLMISLTSPQELDEKKAPQFEQYVLRVVHNVFDLREKIFIFDAGLNDALVEMLKVMLRSQLEELKDCELRFQAIDDVGALAFVALRPGSKPDFRAVPREFYDLVRGPSFPPLEPLGETRGEWLRIDRVLVVERMTAHAASNTPS